MNALWMRQIGGVLRLELKKTFFSKRGWWIYFLALGPVLVTLMHWLIELGRHSGRHSLGEDSWCYAAMFQFFYLRGASSSAAWASSPTCSAPRCWKRRCTTTT